jgi:hypothetical protein
MPGLFTPSIVFTFITHYWFFHHNTLNSDALLDPCFKTGYLTCKTYKSRRTLVVETLDRTRNQGTISCPPARTPEKRPRAPFEIRSFLVETMQLKRSCIRIKLDSTIPRPFPHHLLPLIKKPTVNREPLSSQAAKLFPRYNFRYF